MVVVFQPDEIVILTSHLATILLLLFEKNFLKPFTDVVLLSFLSILIAISQISMFPTRVVIIHRFSFASMFPDSVFIYLLLVDVTTFPDVVFMLPKFSSVSIFPDKVFISQLLTPTFMFPEVLFISHLLSHDILMSPESVDTSGQ